LIPVNEVIAMSEKHKGTYELPTDVGTEGLPPSEEGVRRGPPGGAYQTGPGTAPPNLDVADPHPANEEPESEAPHPGGANPPKNDIGPNDAVHDGTPPPRPHNAGSGPD
jgi:hypothetical protein